MEMDVKQLRAVIAEALKEAKPKARKKAKKGLADKLAAEAVVVLHEDVLSRGLNVVEDGMVDIIDSMLGMEEMTDQELEKCTEAALKRVDWATLLGKYIAPRMVEAVDAACARVSAQRAKRMSRGQGPGFGGTRSGEKKGPAKRRRGGGRASLGFAIPEDSW